MYKKILIISAIVIPTVLLTMFLLMNKSNLGPPKDASSVSVMIQGMVCEYCSQTISQSIKALDGVYKVTVSYPEKRADVLFDDKKINPDTIRQQVKKAGYSFVDPKTDSLQVVDFKFKH